MSPGDSARAEAKKLNLLAADLSAEAADRVRAGAHALRLVALAYDFARENELQFFNLYNDLAKKTALRAWQEPPLGITGIPIRSQELNS